MTDQELKDLVAGLAVQSAKTDRIFQEMKEEQKERDIKYSKELKAQNDEYDKRFTHL
ncbi:MAG: hypothetical protein JJW00_08500 [Sulfurimonas sp.]|nr:hypothetical protein [Sulfurimonas sp.]